MTELGSVKAYYKQRILYNILCGLALVGVGFFVAISSGIFYGALVASIAASTTMNRFSALKVYQTKERIRISRKHKISVGAMILCWAAFMLSGFVVFYLLGLEYNRSALIALGIMYLALAAVMHLKRLGLKDDDVMAFN